jgi:hypothetical protein
LNSLSKHLESLKLELAGLEKRRQVLNKLIDAYEELGALGTPQERRRRERSMDNQVRGAISLRSAVLEVLKAADGPLTTKEIWKRVAEMGAITNSKNPSSVVDLTVYQLKKSGRPVKKTAPATWQYLGGSQIVPTVSPTGRLD